MGCVARFAWGVLLLLMVTASRADGMMEISFMDQPLNGGGYISRYLITDRYLRIDFGQDRDDYVLLDRREHVVYNVVHDQRQIMLIEPGEVTIPKPKKWELEDHVLTDDRSKVIYEITVNGQTCGQITAAPAFLPEAVQAMGEFLDVMRATQATTYLATPSDLQHPCDLARHVLEPQAWLKHGFPMFAKLSDGMIRRLLNYQGGLPVRLRLFVLPEDYRVVRMKDLQAGAAGSQ
jgi:hypothetical protein